MGGRLTRIPEVGHVLTDPPELRRSKTLLCWVNLFGPALLPLVLANTVGDPGWGVFFAWSLLIWGLEVGCHVAYFGFKLHRPYFYIIVAVSVSAGPVVWFRDSCRGLSVDSNTFALCIIMATLITFVGGTRWQSIGFAVFHFVVSFAALAAEFTEVPCPIAGPYKAHSNLGMVLLTFLYQALIYAGVFLLIRLVERQRDELLSVVELSDVIAHRIAGMDLDDIEDFLPDEPTPLEETLMSVVRTLRGFRPYLPDHIFVHHSDSESDDDDLTAPSSPLPPAAQPPTTHHRLSAVALSTSNPPSSLEGSNNTGSGNSSGNPTPLNAPAPVAWERRLSASSVGSLGPPSQAGGMGRKPRGRRVCHRSGLTHRIVTLMYINVTGWGNLGGGIAAATSDTDIKRLERLYTEFWERVTAEVSRYKGSLHWMNGDRLLASWNAVSTIPHHPVLSTRCALALQSVVPSLKVRWEREHHRVPTELQLQLSIVQGDMLVGNLGSDQLKTFHFCGPCVPFLLRLVHLNRVLPTTCLVCSATREAARDCCKFRVADNVLRTPDSAAPSTLGAWGSNAPQPANCTRVYELCSLNEDVEGEWMYEIRQQEEAQVVVEYEKAFDEYCKHNFTGAQKLLEAITPVSSRDDADLQLTLLRHATHYARHPGAAQNLPKPYYRRPLAVWETFTEEEPFTPIAIVPTPIVGGGRRNFGS